MRRFVIRAVHIETHSLAADVRRLLRDAQGTMHASFDLDGSTRIERELPDEERMESLASRVRPLTLSDEPIHHRKVMNAIDLLLRDGGSPTTDHTRRIAELRQLWRKHSLDKDSEVGYWFSMAPADGSEPAVQVTDVQLAAGWFYSDVAHANPDVWKAEALSFSRAHRFEAAVARFSMLAIATLETLGFVRELQEAGLLEIPREAFEADLATAREIPEQTILMAAPAGTPNPGPAGSPPGPNWVRMNVGEAARLVPGNRVDVVLAKEGVEVLKRAGAIISRSHPDEGIHTMEVLVDEAVIFHIVADVNDVEGSRLRHEAVWKTNRALSDGVRLLDQLHVSDSLAIMWNDLQLFRFSIQGTDESPYGHATADYADDVAAIEVMTSVTLPLISEVPGPGRRAEVRAARMAMAGELVDGLRGPAKVHVPSGEPPQGIQLAIRPITLEGVDLPLGPLLMWHPQAQAEQLDEPGTFLVSIPSGETFRVWNPNARTMLPDSNFTPTATLAANPR